MVYFHCCYCMSRSRYRPLIRQLEHDVDFYVAFNQFFKNIKNVILMRWTKCVLSYASMHNHKVRTIYSQKCIIPKITFNCYQIWLLDQKLLYCLGKKVRTQLYGLLANSYLYLQQYFVIVVNLQSATIHFCLMH